jgi:hypothetical protein
MNNWGSLMLQTIETVAEMMAIGKNRFSSDSVSFSLSGFGLPPTAISDLIKFGPHLLAPTGSDLGRFVKYPCYSFQQY